MLTWKNISCADYFDPFLEKYLSVRINFDLYLEKYFYVQINFDPYMKEYFSVLINFDPYLEKYFYVRINFDPYPDVYFSDQTRFELFTKALSCCCEMCRAERRRHKQVTKGRVNLESFSLLLVINNDVDTKKASCVLLTTNNKTNKYK